jgi:thiamine-monophosphate kinase
MVLVSGALGGAAAGLAALQAGIATPLRKRQLRPTPKVALGVNLAKSRLVESAADISDGLAHDALHVAPRGAGVAIDAAALPIDRGVAELAALLRQDPLRLTAAGGEDFELVLAVAPKNVTRVQALARRHGSRLTVVGKVVKKPGVSLGRVTDLAAFDHFRR